MCVCVCVCGGGGGCMYVGGWVGGWVGGVGGCGPVFVHGVFCVSACVGNCRRCSWIGALFVHVCDIFALFMLIILMGSY